MEVVTNNWFSNKYSIGYALSGGFIKGFAHLGAMQTVIFIRTSCTFCTG